VLQLENEAVIASDKEATAAQTVSSLRQHVADVETKRAQLAVLEKNASESRAVLDNFLLRFKQFGPNDKALPQPDAHIISLADTPARPSFPNIKLMLLLVVVLATSVAGLATFVVEALDRRRLRSGEHVESRIGLPVLGLVPIVNPKYFPLQLPGRSGSVALTENLWRQIPDQPRSEYSEAIRRCETSLSLAVGDSPSEVVLVTSAQPKEGKTTFAISLAISAALAGRRVLLIDADCHKPDVGRILGIRGVLGLDHLLKGNGRTDDVIVRHDPTGLDVIVGEQSDFRLAGIAITNFQTALRGLRLTYDFIVIDAPPVLAASETRLLCPMADATAFVVRWADTQDAIVRLALKEISSADAGVSGIVLTMVDPQKHARYGFTDGAFYSKRVRDYYRMARSA
jgi:Mrp family chromosome partitioning ATPase